MQSTIQIFGMSRSGHHAIIKWIAAHYNGAVNHYNNCHLVEPTNTPYKYHQGNHGIFHNSQHIQIQHKNGPDHCEIYSFEQKITPLDIESKNVLCIRDPYNNIASLTKKNVRIETSLYHFKDFASEYLNETNRIKDKILINYNQWFKSIDYRKNLSENFGEFTDEKLQIVPNYWEGSSFDGLQFDGKAQEMDVLNRWKFFKDNEEFTEKVLLNKEIYHLAKKIFEIPEEIEEMIKKRRPYF